jgi:glycine cleavage system protein P-like pyridoxal-binding family
MIDEGFHPMTMYFPLVVHGAMLIEPTETESKQELDRFIHAMRLLAQALWKRRPATSTASRARPSMRRCAVWTKPEPPARRSCAGPRRQGRTSPPSKAGQGGG